jgi:hypothetical protein
MMMKKKHPHHPLLERKVGARPAQERSRLSEADIMKNVRRTRGVAILKKGTEAKTAEVWEVKAGEMTQKKHRLEERPKTVKKGERIQRRKRRVEAKGKRNRERERKTDQRSIAQGKRVVLMSQKLSTSVDEGKGIVEMQVWIQMSTVLPVTADIDHDASSTRRRRNGNWRTMKWTICKASWMPARDSSRRRR